MNCRNILRGATQPNLSAPPASLIYHAVLCCIFAVSLSIIHETQIPFTFFQDFLKKVFGGEEEPHRHCFAMPPPLVGAALAKRSSFTRCQAMMPERLDKSTATHRPPLALPSGELSSDSETERVRPSKSDETRNAARAFQPRAAFPVFPFCFMLP